MPVHANIEAIWVVIIIISVIAQIVKGVKKVASQQQPPAKPARPGGTQAAREDRPPDMQAPEDALQAFLRNLAGEGAPPPPRPVAPVERTVRPPSPIRRTALVRPPRPPARPVAEYVPLAEFRPAEPVREENAEVAPAVTLDRDFRQPSAADSLVQDIKRGLGDRKSIRKAVILREILSPPLALR